MNERFRIYAAVALTGLLVVGGGILFLGRSSASSAASVHQIKPLHPHAKAKVALGDYVRGGKNPDRLRRRSDQGVGP